MNIDIHDSWHTHLKGEFNKPYFKELARFVTSEYKNYRCFPPENQIFNAFNQCPYNEVKVVVIGQDPYHGENQANGLCFSVNDGIKHPPSLVNIFKEIQQDVKVPYPSSGNLMRWARQGVLLLNATLTVRENEAGSHQRHGWEIFTDAVIKALNNSEKDIIFLLWGGSAKKKIKLIKPTHTILTSGHPSPLSANRGYWFGNKHFSRVNYQLEQDDQQLIFW